MMVEAGYQGLGIVAIAVLVILSLLCLLRCILGPRISDRIMAVNMIGTLTIILISLFILLLGEGYLADIALIFAMLSFLSVVVLSKVYTGIYRERKEEEAMLRDDAPGSGAEGGEACKS